jgi:type I restriction enzyme S subunit
MSLPRYAEYKDSGVAWLGDIPASWLITKTKHTCEFSTGWTPPTGDSSAYEGDNLWANISDLGPKVLGNTAKRISDKAAGEAGIKVSPIGSLLFSFKLSVGQVSIAGEEMYTNEAIATFRASSRLVIGYAYYAFPIFLIKNASENIYGAKLLNQELIRSAFLPLPSVGEQSAIAAFLDRETSKIDALIAEQEKLLTLLAEKRQATISHAVTRGLDPSAPMKDSGVPWLGEVPERWQVRTISSLSTKITNGFVGPTRDILVDEGVRYLQSLHIKGNSIRFDSPYYVRQEWSEAHAKSILAAGDVLIVQTGDIGQVAVVSDEFAGCNCHALIIVAPVRDVVAGEWLSWVLNSDYGFHSLLSIQTGALHPHLNCGNVKNVFMPVPPIDEQRRIIAYLQERLHGFEDLSGEAERAITLLKERRSALIAAAVTGKIDVRQEV